MSKIDYFAPTYLQESIVELLLMSRKRVDELDIAEIFTGTKDRTFLS